MYVPIYFSFVLLISNFIKSKVKIGNRLWVIIRFRSRMVYELQKGLKTHRIIGTQK